MKQSTAISLMLALALAAGGASAHQPRLNANQKKAGCSLSSGVSWDGMPVHVMCPSPGTGMCWKKGHNPNAGEPAEAIDVGNPGWGSPDEGHLERCG